FAYIITGLLLYFISFVVMHFKIDISTAAISYMCVTAIGFVLVLTGGTLLSRIIFVKLNNNVFNSLNETFPQEERLLNNEFSINLPARYNLKGPIAEKLDQYYQSIPGITCYGITRKWEILFHYSAYYQAAHPKRIRHICLRF